MEKQLQLPTQPIYTSLIDCLQSLTNNNSKHTQPINKTKDKFNTEEELDIILNRLKRTKIY
jgi:hypothetical protein